MRRQQISQTKFNETYQNKQPNVQNAEAVIVYQRKIRTR